MGYDVFISYHSRHPVGTWVQGYFVGELTSWLHQQFDREATVFFDRIEIETGDVIDERLINALGTSTIFVPVLSPSYFSQSKYCHWEWLCYQKWRPDAIMPVLQYNKQRLPGHVQKMQLADFTPFGLPYPAFPTSPEYGKFLHQVRAFAEEIARRIRAVEAPTEGGFPPDFALPPIPEPEGLPPIPQKRMVA